MATSEARRKEGRNEGGKEGGRKEGRSCTFVKPWRPSPGRRGTKQSILPQFLMCFRFFGGCWLSYFVVVLGFLVCVFLVCSDGFDFPCCFSTFCRKPPLYVLLDS